MYYYCMWYDKLWGPSQRVVTLFLNENGGDDDDGDCTDKTLSETIKHKN